jgi:hypothetical protein
VIKELYHNDTITNSDLEMAGLLFLWLVMEWVCGNLREQRVALFSDNSPTVGWVRRLTAMAAVVAMAKAMTSTMAATMTAVAGTKTAAATEMAGDTDNNRLKGAAEETTAAVTVGGGR